MVRVLVERVEGFATEAAWKRAYREINQFESQLIDSGATIVKFWLQLSKEEQLRRFEQREHTDYKRWKLTSRRLAQPRQVGSLRSRRRGHAHPEPLT